MEIQSVISILEGALEEARQNLANAETEVKVAQREVDFYETVLKLARQSQEDLEESTERDQVIAWTKRLDRGKVFTTTLGEVHSVEEYDALVARQKGTVKAPESHGDGTEAPSPTPTKGRAQRRDRGCF